MNNDDLVDAVLESGREPVPWWREYAETEIPSDPDEVPDHKRRCFAEEDKAKSPYYPLVSPPALPPEALEAGVTREDLQPEG